MTKQNRHAAVNSRQKPISKSERAETKAWLNQYGSIVKYIAVVISKLEMQWRTHVLCFSGFIYFFFFSLLWEICRAIFMTKEASLNSRKISWGCSLQEMCLQYWKSPNDWPSAGRPQLLFHNSGIKVPLYSVQALSIQQMCWVLVSPLS